MGVGPRVAILIAFAACHQPAHLTSVQPEPAGANCADGGVVIRTGSDDNGNGALDASEVDSESYVCAGEGTTGHDSLADTQPIAPGSECTNGGTRVRTGVDVDDDGILDDAEVVKEVVVCAGDGPATVIATRYEPPGSHCERGGTAVDSGFDTNGNGVLDTGEVANTTFFCNGDLPPSDVVIGDILVRTGFDVALLAGVKHVVGSVTVLALPGIDPVIAPKLEQIDSLLTVGNSTVTVDFPVLSSARFVTIAHTTTVTTVSLPALTTAERIDVLDDTNLAMVALPRLASVTDSMTLADVPSLASVRLPALDSAGTLSIARVPLPSELDLSALTSIGRLTVQQMALTSLALPALASAVNVTVTNSSSLAQISMPMLGDASEGIVFQGLPALSAVELSALTSAGSLQLEQLPLLLEGNTDLRSLLQITNVVMLRELGWTTTSALSSLRDAGAITIASMPDLTTVDAPALTSSAFGIGIQFCPKLTDVSGFAALQAVGSISLFENFALGHVAGFAQLQRIGQLDITSNRALTTISGFGAVTTIDALRVFDNELLGDFTFPSLIATPSETTITGNPNIHHLAFPDGPAVLGKIELQGNTLVSVSGFGEATSASKIEIAGAPLVTIPAFPKLASVDDLRIFSNQPLALPFPSLRTAGYLEVGGPVTDLGGLAFIQHASELHFALVDFQTLRLPDLTDVGAIFLLAPKLVAVDLPRLTTIATVSWDQMDALESVSMPALTAITGGELDFTPINAPRLPLCQITDLFVQTGFTGEAPPSLPPCHTIDRCRLTVPLDAVVSSGASVPSRGHLLIAGVTDATAGVDEDVVLRAAVGIGDAGTDPTTHPSWTFVPAVANPTWDDALEPGFDEYTAGFTATPGLHDVAFRFSGDGGRTWTYCDRDAGPGSDGSEDGYQPANAGHVEVP